MINFMPVEPTIRFGVVGQLDFIVLGCGGTGSMFIPRLAAYMKTTGVEHSITICDADMVEPKNLVRQNFSLGDVGKNKAEVLAKKCNTVYNTEIAAFPHYVESVEGLERLYRTNNGIPIGIPVIVGCVDTNAVRKMIHNYMKNCKYSVIWLDSGNAEYHGQVCCGIKVGSPSSRRINGGRPHVEGNLPLVTEYFPDMLESTEKFTSDLSCAEHAISHPQAAVTNQTAANILMQFVTAIVTRNIVASMVTFDVQTMITSTRRITQTALTKRGYGIPGSVISTYQELDEVFELEEAARIADDAAAEADDVIPEGTLDDADDEVAE